MKKMYFFFPGLLRTLEILYSMKQEINNNLKKCILKVRLVDAYLGFSIQKACLHVQQTQ